METYRIICFANGVLEEWEELQAANVLDAIEQATAAAAGRTRCQRLEIWGPDRRVAVLRQVGHSGSRPHSPVLRQSGR